MGAISSSTSRAMASRFTRATIPIFPSSAAEDARPGAGDGAEHLDEWLPSAAKRFDGARFYIVNGNLRDAAFDLHQTTERYYHCVLLVCTFYTPHVHNLGFLRTQAERIDQRLIDVWPRETKGDRSRFEKLKEAYVKARYSKHLPGSRRGELALASPERIEPWGKAVGRG